MKRLIAHNENIELALRGIYSGLSIANGWLKKFDSIFVKEELGDTYDKFYNILNKMKDTCMMFENEIKELEKITPKNNPITVKLVKERNYKNGMSYYYDEDGYIWELNGINYWVKKNKSGDIIKTYHKDEINMIDEF